MTERSLTPDDAPPPGPSGLPDGAREDSPGGLPRRRAVVFVAVALLVAGGGAAAALSGSGGPRTVSVTPLLQAADIATRGPGYQFDGTVTATQGGKTTTIDEEGSIDERNSQGTITLHLAGHALLEIFRLPYVYTDVAGPSTRTAAGGKPWVSLNLGAITEEFGAEDGAEGDSSGPREFIEFLKGSAQATVVGHEPVRGEPTTHYHAVVDLNRYAAVVAPSRRAGARKAAAALESVTGSSTLAVDAWIGADDRLRRYEVEEHLCSPAGPIGETVSFEIVDYGPQPAVKVPMASETRDITAAVRGELAKGLQELSCPGSSA